MMLRATCAGPELMALHLRSREEGCCIPQSSAAWKMSLQFKKKLSNLKKKKSVSIYTYIQVYTVMREQQHALMFVRKQNELKGKTTAQWGPDLTFPPWYTIEIKICQEYKDIVKRRHQSITYIILLFLIITFGVYCFHFLLNSFNMFVVVC